MQGGRFSEAEWRMRGFAGFQNLLTLDRSLVPRSSGVYVVLRADLAAPTFNDQSCGGHFKQKDPSVPRNTLEAEWVPGTETVYIGKATELCTRLGQFRSFGTGKRVGHWGGRYIWQLADAAELTVCWRETPGDPRDVERTLIAEFARVHGRRPFANLID